jgi:hypothetical protein
LKYLEVFVQTITNSRAFPEKFKNTNAKMKKMKEMEKNGEKCKNLKIQMQK